MSLFSISPTDLAASYRALGALYNAGVGPSHAFSFLVETTQSRPLKRALKGLSEVTSDGTPVSIATARFPRIFPALHRTVIASGEASGLMPSTLSGLAEMVERDHVLKLEVKRELTDTKLTLIIGMPIAVCILASIGWDRMPLWAKVVVPVFSVTEIVMLVAAALLIQINNEAETRYGPIVNRLPAIGKVTRMLAENRFTLILALCHDAGILPMRSIGLAVEACGSPSMKSKLLRAVPAVRDGMTMAASLEATYACSNYLISMIKVGEESGKIAETLYTAQEQQASDIVVSLHQLKHYIKSLASYAAIGLAATGVVLFWTMCYGF